MAFFSLLEGILARINIEEGFWTDIGIVTAALGDELRAIGAVIKFWRLAQLAHKKGEYISEADFEMHGFVEAMIPVFAERKPGGIQARGAEKHFGWLTKRVEAGRKGGQAKRSKSKQPEASPSSSFSFSSSASDSHSNSEIHNTNKSTRGGSANQPRADGRFPATPFELETRQRCWEKYTKAYDDLWKTLPVRNATTNSQMANFVKRIGEDAPEVISFYVSHKDSHYIKKLHPVGLALQDAESLHTQWKTQTQVTSTKVRQYEKSQFHQEQMDRIDKGLV